MSSTGLIWFQFCLCATLIGTVGFKLSLYGDAIAKRSGLFGSWIGLALLATVTSLPELATGITSVSLAHAPELAEGDALGSCVVNLTFLVLVDFLFRKEPVWHRTSRGHVFAAAFGVIMRGLVLVSLLISRVTTSQGEGLAQASARLGFSLATPILLVLDLVAMRTVFTYERDHATPASIEFEPTLPTLRTTMTRFALAAGVVAAAGIWLPFVATDLGMVMCFGPWVGSVRGCLPCIC